jgi:carboxyl-terminal processing protease
VEVKQEKQDNTKFLKTVLMILVVLFVGVLMFGGGFVVGRFMPAAGAGVIPAQLQPSAPSGDQQSNTPEGLQDTFAPFWETWNLVHSQYVEQPVDDVALVQGAIRGMLETLTVGRNYYYDPKEMQNEQDVLNGKDYEGIGAYVDVDGEYLTVVSAIRGSPAEAAGLRSGDQFIAVDGKDVTGQPPEDVRLKVIGPAGTDVVLTVLRKGVDAPFDVTITRAKITTPLVEYELRDDGIAYVRLNTFGDSADAELRDALKELLAKNPKGLILDLRYNGGGYLDQGIAVASEFLPADKPVVYEKFGTGDLEESKSLGNGVATDIPMVLLVNEGSASASEIVAGALQDYERATLVGVTTYGKGSVQNYNVLANGQGAVGVTVAQWLTPNKRLIEKVGLDPDIFVANTDESLAEGKDLQLDAAVQTLMAMINGKPLPTSQPTPVITPTP